MASGRRPKIKVARCPFEIRRPFLSLRNSVRGTDTNVPRSSPNRSINARGCNVSAAGSPRNPRFGGTWFAEPTPLARKCQPEWPRKKATFSRARISDRRNDPLTMSVSLLVP